MDKKIIGLKLAKVRQAKELSAYELSLRIGKAPNYMHYIETGKANMSMDTFFAICKELEISPKELFE